MVCEQSHLERADSHYGRWVYGVYVSPLCANPTSGDCPLLNGRDSGHGQRGGKDYNGYATRGAIAPTIRKKGESMMKTNYIRYNPGCLKDTGCLMILMTVVCLIGCTNSLLDGGGGDLKDIVGKIVLHQTGGFAGFSRITTIEEKDGLILLTFVDERTKQTSESQVSAEALDGLWKTLEANDVFTLPTNQKMLDHVADGFGYEITIERGDKRNQFSVYAPEILADWVPSGHGEKRYNAIVEAIQKLADSRQPAGDFIIADMPINDISVAILESFPVQVQVAVEGYLSDGCTELNEITQRREGNTIHIRITTKRPKDVACIQIIKAFQDRIRLEGDFPAGNYKVIVNGVEKEFRI